MTSYQVLTPPSFAASEIAEPAPAPAAAAAAATPAAGASNAGSNSNAKKRKATTVITIDSDSDEPGKDVKPKIKAEKIKGEKGVKREKVVLEIDD